MEPLSSAVLLAGAAGLSLPLGGLLALVAHSREKHLDAYIVRSVTAFGGGALLAAVALVLVPEGSSFLPVGLGLALFCAGGLCFYVIDLWLERRGGSGAMLLATLLDFLPEALALGAMLVAEAATAKLLALMIFLQNLPEGYSSFREIWRDGTSTAPLLVLFLGLAALGPLCAAAGVLFLASMHGLLGGIMVFSAGGILYLIFQDVAPSVRTRYSNAPALGAVLGFGFGLVGAQLIH